MQAKGFLNRTLSAPTIHYDKFPPPALAKKVKYLRQGRWQVLCSGGHNSLHSHAWKELCQGKDSSSTS